MTNSKMASKDVWSNLKAFTTARIALGRAGGSLRTDDWLDFKLAHAKARDAVHCDFDSVALVDELSLIKEGVLLVASKVKDRGEYLKRPDLGRCLNAGSKQLLLNNAKASDVVFIVSDGLSATAVQAHAKNVLSLLIPMLLSSNWTVPPLVVARFGRVAIEDEIGALIGAKIAVILIGERPGLGAADSLGAYIVHNPKVGNTDANRNCVSNIRPAGLCYEQAVETLLYLLNESKVKQLSGVNLKDGRVPISVSLGKQIT